MKEEFYDSKKINQILRKIWLRAASMPIIIFVVYLIMILTGIFNRESDSIFYEGIISGVMIFIILRGVQAKYIYHYSMEDKMLKLFLVNLFGKKVMLSIPVNQIVQIRHKSKGAESVFDKLWIRSKDSVDDFIFIGENRSDELVQKVKSLIH